MAVSKEDILETISNMSVMDVVELIEAMEEKFGVSAAAPVAVAAGPAAGGEAAAAEEKTEFDVDLANNLDHRYFLGTEGRENHVELGLLFSGSGFTAGSGAGSDSDRGCC